jgi:hypothetical protein
MMHPKQICEDFKSMGAALIVEGNALYIDNPEKVHAALQDFAKSYKARIIKFLNGKYSEKDHAVNQTMDKIVDFYRGATESNSKIEEWLKHDEESIQKFNKLLVLFWNNGWRDFTDPVANFENDETDRLSKEIFERAMNFYRKGAAV